MIQHTEKQIYDYLQKIIDEKNVNMGDKYKVYRGFLPSNSFEDRENGEKSNNYFPFVILRALSYEQRVAGFGQGDSYADFEIWIGTKEEKEEDYINNLAMGDFIREKLLENSTVENGFSIDQSKDFRVEFYSDQSKPYYYSKINFTVFAEPIQSKVKTFRKIVD